MKFRGIWIGGSALAIGILLSFLIGPETFRENRPASSASATRGRSRRATSAGRSSTRERGVAGGSFCPWATRKDCRPGSRERRVRLGWIWPMGPSRSKSPGSAPRKPSRCG